jgi:putative AlgH/UPF0301 family transcriptional regulator
MNLRDWTDNLVCALVYCLLMVVLEAHAQEIARPMMLVASPSLRGAYSETLVAAVPKDGGHVGFILNRVSDVKLASLFPEHKPSGQVADPVYFGGPQQPRAIFAVLRRNPGGDAWSLFDGFFAALSVQSVDRIIEQTPNDARYFAGHVAWKPGELEREIGRGYWFVTEPDASLLRRDTRGAWDELVKRLGNGHAPARNLISASL